MKHTTHSLAASLLVVCACASTSTERSSTVATGRTGPAAASPSQARDMTLEAWRRAVADGAFTPTELAPVGERQEMVGPIPPEGTPPAGAVWAIRCMPGGASDSFAMERASGHLWRVTMISHVNAPEGVVISATRCYAQAERLPEGRAVHGTVRVTAP